MNIFTGADKGLSPAWCQAITWASYELLSIKSLSTNFMQWKLIQNTDIFFPENVFENVVCNISAILLRPQCADGLISLTSVKTGTFSSKKVHNSWKVFFNSSTGKDILLVNCPTSEKALFKTLSELMRELFVECFCNIWYFDCWLILWLNNP